MEGLTVLFFVLAAALVALVFVPRLLSHFGDFFIERILRRGLPETDYQVLRDVRIETPAGPVRIAHLVVSVHGVFVIESCHFGGKIYGTSQNSEWTSVGLHTRRYVSSPLERAENLAMALEDRLNLDSSLVLPLAVFSRRVTFKTYLPPNVIRSTRLIHRIRSQELQRQGFDEVQRILQCLENDAADKSEAALEGALV